MATSVRWSRGRLLQSEVVDEMLLLISELIREANDQQQQPGNVLVIFRHDLKKQDSKHDASNIFLLNCSCSWFHRTSNGRTDWRKAGLPNRPRAVADVVVL